MEKLLDEKQAADILGLSPRTLQGWRLRGQGPQFVKIGRLTRYRPEDIEAYVKAQAQAQAKAQDQDQAQEQAQTE